MMYSLLVAVGFFLLHGSTATANPNCTSSMVSSKKVYACGGGINSPRLYTIIESIEFSEGLDACHARGLQLHKFDTAEKRADLGVLTIAEGGGPVWTALQNPNNETCNGTECSLRLVWRTAPGTEEPYIYLPGTSVEVSASSSPLSMPKTCVKVHNGAAVGTAGCDHPYSAVCDGFSGCVAGTNLTPRPFSTGGKSPGTLWPVGELASGR